MADVTETVAQEAVADSLVSEPTPQEATAEQAPAGTEAVDTSQQVETQAEVEQPVEEYAEDWLPTEQDKIFADDVYARYAERYQLTPEQAADPLLRQLLHDKINSDIFLRQQQEAQQFEVPEPESESTQQEAQTLPTFEQHFNNLNQWVERNTDPRVAQMFADNFMKAFGVTEAAKPEVARALTNTMATFGLNLIQTALPQMLAPLLENVMPGMSGMYYQSARAQSWDTIRNSSAEYANLPAYGSREFMDLCARLDQEYPALTEMGYSLERTNGGQLHGPAADKFYSTLAKLATKQAVDPQKLLEAAQAGARNARRADVRRSAGNLGAGQSKGAIQNRSSVGSKFTTNQDLFDDDTMEFYQRQHGRM